MFWLAAGIYAACGIFFAIFCSGDLQKWNDVEEEEKESDQNNIKKKNFV